MHARTITIHCEGFFGCLQNASAAGKWHSMLVFLAMATTRDGSASLSMSRCARQGPHLGAVQPLGASAAKSMSTVYHRCVYRLDSCSVTCTQNPRGPAHHFVETWARRATPPSKTPWPTPSHTVLSFSPGCPAMTPPLASACVLCSPLGLKSAGCHCASPHPASPSTFLCSWPPISPSPSSAPLPPPPATSRGRP